MNTHLHRTPRCTLGLSTIIVPYMTLSKYHSSFKLNIRRCLIIIAVICACLVYMYSCVCVCAHVHMGVCVPACECLWRPEVNTSFPLCFPGASHRARSSFICLGWLVNELQRSPCLAPTLSPRPGVTDMRHQAQLFVWVLRTHTQALNACRASL